MRTVIAKLQESGSIYFQKLLARSPNCKFGQLVSLVVPMRFVKEHGNKFEEWTILRTQSSPKPWRVRFSVYKALPQVRFMGGWKRFATDKCLKEGDSLVFVLNVTARSEFQVYIFGGTGHESLEEQNSMEHNSGAASEVLTDTESKGLASQNGTNSLRPSFRKRLKATNYQYSLFEVPASFVKTHGVHLRDHEVELEGICKESPVRIVTFHTISQKQGNQARLYFKGGWSGFSKENGLHVGQELQFTLVSKLFFVVRVV